MSRIGNKIIPVPAGVKIQIKPHEVEVQGPKGKMNVPLPSGICFEQKDGILTAKRASDEQRALHGLSRALVANAVTGVTTGFKKDLDIVGVGYRAEVKGKNVVLALGYSHPIEFPIPEGITILVEKQTHLAFSGANKNHVGQVGREPARPAAARPVQAEGRSHHGREIEEEGWQGRREVHGGLEPGRRRESGSTVRSLSRQAHRRRIHVRTRKTLIGTSDRPRLCVHRTLEAHSRAGGGRPEEHHHRFRQLARRHCEEGHQGRRQYRGGESRRQSDRSTRRRARASTKSFTIAVVINITGA